MQILVNTDTFVHAGTELAGEIESHVTERLARFSAQLTRIEVHLSDQNADKPGDDDLQCMIEARPAGMQPVAVTHRGATVHAAYTGAVTKMRSHLDTTFGRLEKRKGRDSIRHPS